MRELRRPLGRQRPPAAYLGRETQHARKIRTNATDRRERSSNSSRGQIRTAMKLGPRACGGKKNKTERQKREIENLGKAKPKRKTQVEKWEKSYQKRTNVDKEINHEATDNGERSEANSERAVQDTGGQGRGES